MASEGYPGAYEKGRPIRGLEEAAAVPDVKVFHAGTQAGRWPGRHRRRPRARRHRPGQYDRHGQAAGLHRRQVHPLGRRLVPQGHLRQGHALRRRFPAPKVVRPGPWPDSSGNELLSSDNSLVRRESLTRRRPDCKSPDVLCTHNDSIFRGPISTLSPLTATRSVKSPLCTLCTPCITRPFFPPVPISRNSRNPSGCGGIAAASNHCSEAQPALLDPSPSLHTPPTPRSIANQSLRSKTILASFRVRTDLQPCTPPEPSAARAVPPPPLAATFFTVAFGMDTSGPFGESTSISHRLSRRSSKPTRVCSRLSSGAPSRQTPCSHANSPGRSGCFLPSCRVTPPAPDAHSSKRMLFDAIDRTGCRR